VRECCLCHWQSCILVFLSETVARAAAHEEKRKRCRTSILGVCGAVEEMPLRFYTTEHQEEQTTSFASWRNAHDCSLDRGRHRIDTAPNSTKPPRLVSKIWGQLTIPRTTEN
jgi:hypothetical protein